MSAATTSTVPTPVDSPKIVAKNDKGDESKKKKKKERTRKRAKRNPRKRTLKTKVIVRRLPPNLPEDIFMNTVKPWITEENTDYSLYVAGKFAKSKGKENIFSRAYFHFKTMEAVVAFHQGFDGHMFIDSRGNESRAVVEFAPYQKTPKEHKVADTRQGTIEEDPDYLEFLESLKNEENKQSEAANEPADGLSHIERLENRIALVTAETLAAEQASKPKTTPLLEHLRAQKAAQAATKAKQLEKRNEKKKSERSKRSEKTSQQPSSAAAPTENKKPRRDRNRKKKEDDSKGSSEKPSRSRPPKEGGKQRRPPPKKANNSGGEAKQDSNVLGWQQFAAESTKKALTG